MQVSNCIVILCAALAVAACVTNGNDQSGSTVTLLGEEWVVEDIGALGVIDYARATIRFGLDGRLSGDTSCNRYFADYQADGTKEVAFRIACVFATSIEADYMSSVACPHDSNQCGFRWTNF